MVNMGRSLRVRFIAATQLATCTLGELAEGIGRRLRTVLMYRKGQRRVTPDAARALAAFLRERAKRFQRVAEDLEAAAEKEERR